MQGSAHTTLASGSRNWRVDARHVNLLRRRQVFYTAGLAACFSSTQVRTPTVWRALVLLAISDFPVSCSMIKLSKKVAAIDEQVTTDKAYLGKVSRLKLFRLSSATNCQRLASMLVCRADWKVESLCV